MGALVDKRLWVVLKAMLDEPGELHTVESLADKAGMSRSTFAEHFSEAYGTGPMSLLRILRMNRACQLLEKSDIPVKRIAEMVGFQSRSAFTRMFDSIVGKSPREFRQEQKRKSTQE